MAEPTTLQDYASSISETHKAVVTEQINTLYKELVLDREVSVIPEKVFVELFLDFFRSGGQMNTEAPLTVKWLELAGGPYNQVNVLGEKGETLYSVPGIYCKPNVDNLNLDYSKIASNFTLRSNRMHEDGINYLTQQLNGLDKKISVEYDAYLLKWKSIFNRYSKPTLPGSKTTVAVNDNINDFLSYD